MNYFKWVIASLVAAAVGGAIWVVVGLYMNAEVGYIAWGIGLLAGLGVRMTSDEDGFLPGFVALGCAVFVIAISKFAVVSLLVDRALADGFPNGQVVVTESQMILPFADEVEEEWRKQKKTFKASPINPDSEDDDPAASYDPKVWQEASQRWAALPEAEKGDRRQRRQAEVKEFATMLAGTIKSEAFKQSFGLFDILWFALGAMTAFRVGSGATSDD